MDKKSTENHVSTDVQPGTRLPVEASFQKTLMPLDVITTYTSDQNSADLKFIVEARDGKHYAVKTLQDGNGKVPASELFCYELAYRVIIATPPYSLISLPNGDLAFGSAWEGGVVNGRKDINYQAFIHGVLDGSIQVSRLDTFFSRLYAFDLFVNNLDRHWGNYLWRQSYGDSIIAMAFDFSRACFEIGHEGFEAANPGSNTQIVFKMLNVKKRYSRDEAVACLEAIRAITTQEISAILDNFPAAWMSKQDRKAYLEWWDSQARHTRIDKLMNYL